MFIGLLLVSVVQSYISLTHRGVYCLIVQCTIYSSIGTVTVINGNLAIKHIIDHKWKHFSSFFYCLNKSASAALLGTVVNFLRCYRLKGGGSEGGGAGEAAWV